MPKFLFSPGVKNLFNLFDQVPGFIISAGPSLEKNVHLLKEAEGKALLLATAPVVKILLAYDIQPDLVISVDFAEGNSIHFEGLWGGQGIPLIYPIRLASKIVRDFQGDMLAIQDEGVWLSRNWEEKGSLATSGSVAGWALKAIIRLGCDPIIFVGQDLSYSDKTHVEGSARSRKLDPASLGERLYWAQGVFGEQVLTSERFIAFLHDIEDTIAQHKRKFINATASGLRIQGTEEISLEECIRKYCRRRIHAPAVVKRAGSLEKVDFEGLLKDLEAKSEEIKGTLNLCLKGFKILKVMEKRLKKGRLNGLAVDSLLWQIEETGVPLKKFYDSFSLFRFLLSKDLRLLRTGAFVNRPEYGLEKNLTLCLERNRLIFSASCQALKELQGKIKNLYGRLQTIVSCRNRLEKNPSEGSAHYRLAKVFGEIGLHRLAVEEYMKALDFEEDRLAIYYEMGRSFLHLEELNRAREYFHKVKEMAPNSELVRRGLEEIEGIIRHWLEKAESKLQDGNWVNALLYSRKALGKGPHCIQAQRIEEAAKVLRDEKVARMEEAREQEKVRRQEERKNWGLLAKGKEFFNQRKFPQAVEIFQKALELGCNQLEGKRLLALGYLEKGEMGQARKILEGLSAQYPESGLYYYHLGQALLQAGDWVEGVEKLELAAKRERKYIFGLFEAGSIFMKMKDYERASGCFEKYFQMSPDTYEILGKIGTCYLAQGKLPQAKEKYRQALQIFPAYGPALLGLQKIEELEERSRLIPKPNMGLGISPTKEAE